MYCLRTRRLKATITSRKSITVAFTTQMPRSKAIIKKAAMASFQSISMLEDCRHSLYFYNGIFEAFVALFDALI
jgi:hypothetical protein